MTRTVMAFKLKDRTVTQTDMAPSWISEAEMAPVVIHARMGRSMKAPFLVLEVAEMKNAQDGEVEGA